MAIKMTYVTCCRLYNHILGCVVELVISINEITEGYLRIVLQEPDIHQISWNGSGSAIPKTITCAEVMKRKIKVVIIDIRPLGSGNVSFLEKYQVFFSKKKHTRFFSSK